ncbi:hypothetical protein [Streptomyces cylindrosporus]|uniref:Uncharacterized protein n=1 Tax=Streptomyces cylindrosporus TaxID=2927583 RepID=A0ABS9YHG7_9ACTN|nr:hypothetical protein [Streptomyces cylindrosporus]MCI3276683.1 hypothetical protein [Streptomyces cylindrosporus]
MAARMRFLPRRLSALLRRTVAGDQERDMPRQLLQDLEQALELTDETTRRAAVDRVVRGIADGTYGTGFRRRALNAADRSRPDATH